MRCASGHDNDDSMRFCGECGVPLRATPLPPPPPGNQGHNEPAPFPLDQGTTTAVAKAVQPTHMDPAVQWQCSSGHVVHRSRELCLVCGELQADEREPAVASTPFHAAKAAKAAQRQGGGELALTEAQSAALKSDRERTWKIAIVGAIAAIAAIGGLIALALEDNSDTAKNTRSEPTGCTWDWVPGKAPVDVGWTDAVQYCYPE